MPANDKNELAKQFSISLPIAAALVAFGGLFAAGVLSAGHILKLPVPCGSSSGCVAVASDPSSRFAGIPIAFFGGAPTTGWVVTAVQTKVAVQLNGHFACYI